MVRNAKRLNIVMGGGGVKGIAFAGTFDIIQRKGYIPVNLAGVSSGAIAAALAGAGCNAGEMWDALGALDFGKLSVNSIEKKVPAVRYLASFAKYSKLGAEETVRVFLNHYSSRAGYFRHVRQEPLRGILQSIAALGREGCLYDGDLLEEWIYGILQKKGIRTFADLRGGRPDEKNPYGYKVRMTGVDCNRLMVVTLPDDLAFYGIEPDRLEVAKAVRISTSVPFAFKPVVLKKTEAGSAVSYHLVDGGVLDSFPSWLIGNGGIPSAGLRLRSSGNKIFGLNSPLSIFKSLVSAVHDIGTPKDSGDSLAFTGDIDTGDIGFLEFDISDDQKQQLYESGRRTALAMLP